MTAHKKHFLVFRIIRTQKWKILLLEMLISVFRIVLTQNRFALLLEMLCGVKFSELPTWPCYPASSSIHQPGLPDHPCPGKGR